MKRKFALTIGAVVVALIALNYRAVAQTGLTLINSVWVNGALVFEKADDGTDLLTIATTGVTAPSLTAAGKTLAFYSGSIASGSATATITAAGVDADDYVFGALQTTGADGAIETLVSGSGSVAVTLHDVADTTTTIVLMAWQD